MTADQPHGQASLVWIGIFKLLKGLLLVAAASGILASMNGDLQTTVSHWVKALHFDADNRYIAGLLHKIGLVDERNLKKLGGLTFVYGAIFLTEGTGLILKKRWAEYLTVVVTLSFIPLEIYEIAKHCNVVKIALLAVNVAIVAYLIVTLKRKSKTST